MLNAYTVTSWIPRFRHQRSVCKHQNTYNPCGVKLFAKFVRFVVKTLYWLSIYLRQFVKALSVALLSLNMLLLSITTIPIHDKSHMSGHGSCLKYRVTRSHDGIERIFQLGFIVQGYCDTMNLTFRMFAVSLSMRLNSVSRIHDMSVVSVKVKKMTVTMCNDYNMCIFFHSISGSPPV